MKKVILFDLYDTVLKDIFFDFQAGLTYLHDTYLSKACTRQEVLDYADSFRALYQKRRVDHSEICLIRDQIPLYFERFGMERPEDMDALEYAIMSHMQQVTLLDEVRCVLEELQRRGIPMYILSNGIFTGKAVERLLDHFGISFYFDGIYSSADYGVRKPGQRFFQIAIDQICAAHSVTREDILYVGNDYVTDVQGATQAGLDVVWYNVRHLPDERDVGVREMDDFRKVLEMI